MAKKQSSFKIPPRMQRDPRGGLVYRIAPKPTGRARFRVTDSGLTPSTPGGGVVVPGITYLLQDEFTDTDDVALTSHTKNFGPAWTGNATPKISSNKATAVTDMSLNCTVADVGAADGILSVRVGGAYGDSDCNQPMIVLRYVSDNSYSFVTFTNAAVSLFKIINKATTLLATAAYTFVDGTEYNVRIVLINESVKVYINGVLVLNDSDSYNQTAKKFGLVNYRVGTPAHEATWDSFHFLPTWTPSIVRDWTKLIKFSDNPIIPFNAGAYNSLGADTVYIRLNQRIGNTYYMITQANDRAFSYEHLALYTSTDLKRWAPFADNPVLSVSLGSVWDHTYINHPSIINIGGVWYMYYGAYDQSGNYAVGLATSTNFVNWTKHSGAIYMRTAYSPCVIKIGNLYYMYYWNSAAGYANLMEYATSPDGLTWTFQGVVIGREAGDWDEAKFNVGYDPWVIQNKDGFYEMVYTVYTSSPVQSVGYATSPDGIYWVKSTGPILVPSGTPGTWDELYVGDPNILEIDGYLYLYFAAANANGQNQGGLAWLVT